MDEMSLYPRPDDRNDAWPTGDPALAAFVDDLRIIGSGPAPEPRPGLVAVMRQGPSDPVVSTPGRRKMLVKTVVGSLAAKLAFGVGAAAASVTAAGAAGVLPDPAQHVVASVVGATTPFALPDPSTVTPQVSRDTAGTTTTTLAGGIGGEDSGDDSDDATGTRTANHGACVSAAAKADTGPGPHGKVVSSIARSDCGKTAVSTSTTVVSPTTTTIPGSTTTSTAVTTTTTLADDAARSANSGRGNSNGNSGSGNGGNSGNGNSGRR